MPAVCFYFQVHQPLRVKRYRIFDIGKEHDYFAGSGENNLNNEQVLAKVARKCYLPTNALLEELLNQYPQFRVSFSLSGVLLDQLERLEPAVVESFQRLAATGQVEFLAETYYHTLAFMYSPAEWQRQIKLHQQKIKQLFGQTPQVFRNTELIYRDDLGPAVEQLGFKGVLAEGADHILEWRSPNFVYQTAATTDLRLLVKNYRLSDDIAFRFSCRDWENYPLTAPTFANWISAINGSGEVVNLFMDYETFGEHQWADTGIFDFLRALPAEILKHPDNTFVTPSEAIARYQPAGQLNFPRYVSWADTERDLSAWLSNSMQRTAADNLFALEAAIMERADPVLLSDWRHLQTSDHFYYMCTKWFADGDVHKYFNPYDSPYEAFISYMNVLNDIKLRLQN